MPGSREVDILRLMPFRQNIDKIHICDKINYMKSTKAILLLLTCVFSLSVVGLCDTACSTDDAGHHCVSSCSAGCHAALLSLEQISAALLVSTSIIQSNAALHQELFISGIKYPPKSII